LFDNLIQENAHSNAIDIYFLRSGISYGRASGIPGLALVIGGNYAGTSVLSHEMGHCLGLYHTHSGRGCGDFANCAEEIDGSNCDICGDLVCDTPADPCLSGNVNASCQYTGPSQFNPDVGNIMSYTPPYRMTHFTNEQFDRAFTIVENDPMLSSLITMIQIISDSIICDEVWATDVLVVGNVTVNSGITLTILPDIVVNFNPTIKLTVNGVLNAKGTSLNPIIFKPDSVKWYGIVFENGSSGYLQCCEIKNSKNMIIIKSGADVKMCDDNEITLQPGFTVELGGKFYAYVDPSLEGGLNKFASYSNKSNGNEETNKDSTQNFQNNLPANYSLFKNYPNPFNSTTTLKYALKEKTKVTIKIYNIIGKEIITIVNETQPAGYQSVTWNGTDSYGNPVPSGIYIYRMVAGNFTKSYKMVLIK